MESSLKTDFSRYEVIIKDLRQKKTEFEGTLQNLMSENARLSDLSVQRLREIDALKVKYSHDHDDSDPAIVDQLENYKKTTIEIREQLLKSESEKRNYEQQIQRLTHNIETTKTENQRLYDTVNQKNIEYDSLVKQVILMTDYVFK